MCASPAEGNALHFDPTRLTPEQIEQFKTLLGIGSSNEQQPSTPVAFDPGTLTNKQVEALKQALETSEFYISSLTRKILSEQITMGYVYENWDTIFAEMNSVQVDGFGASSSAGLADYIELLAKAVNRLVERVNRLEVGQ